MHQWCAQYRIEIWGYCLMPNHIHLIAVPQTEDSLTRAIGEMHRRYTRYVNFLQEWRGHLWQGRFASYAMDERYLLSCIRYIELNPVKAKLVQNPAEWRWSSARAHFDGHNEGAFNATALLDMVDSDWAEFLRDDIPDKEIAQLRKHERTGRPLGDPAFIEQVESQLHRCLKPNKPGPAPAARR